MTHATSSTVSISRTTSAITEIHAAAERVRRVLNGRSGGQPVGSVSYAGQRGRALAHATVAVSNAAIGAALDYTDASIDKAMRRLVREALHVLGPEALHELCARPAGQLSRLREMSAATRPTRPTGRERLPRPPSRRPGGTPFVTR